MSSRCRWLCFLLNYLLFTQNADSVSQLAHEQIIVALAPLLENNHPTQEICDFFSKVSQYAASVPASVSASVSASVCMIHIQFCLQCESRIAEYPWRTYSEVIYWLLFYMWNCETALLTFLLTQLCKRFLIKYPARVATDMLGWIKRMRLNQLRDLMLLYPINWHCVVVVCVLALPEQPQIRHSHRALHSSSASHPQA